MEILRVSFRTRRLPDSEVKDLLRPHTYMHMLLDEVGILPSKHKAFGSSLGLWKTEGQYPQEATEALGPLLRAY